MIQLSLFLKYKARSLDIGLKLLDWTFIPKFYIDREEDFYWRFDFLFLYLVYINRIDWAYLLFKD